MYVEYRKATRMCYRCSGAGMQLLELSLCLTALHTAFATNTCDLRLAPQQLWSQALPANGAAANGPGLRQLTIQAYQTVCVTGGIYARGQRVEGVLVVDGAVQSAAADSKPSATRPWGQEPSADRGMPVLAMLPYVASLSAAFIVAPGECLGHGSRCVLYASNVSAFCPTHAAVEQYQAHTTS